jgi:hypothetical protein
MSGIERIFRIPRVKRMGKISRQTAKPVIAQAISTFTQRSTFEIKFSPTGGSQVFQAG